MSKLIFISLFILPNLLFAQTIYMHPTNGQRHYQWGKQQHVHEVIKNPDFSFDKSKKESWRKVYLRLEFSSIMNKEKTALPLERLSFN